MKKETLEVLQDYRKEFETYACQTQDMNSNSLSDFMGWLTKHLEEPGTVYSEVPSPLNPLIKDSDFAKY